MYNISRMHVHLCYIQFHCTSLNISERHTLNLHACLLAATVPHTCKQWLQILVHITTHSSCTFLKLISVFCVFVHVVCCCIACMCTVCVECVIVLCGVYVCECVLYDTCVLYVVCVVLCCKGFIQRLAHWDFLSSFSFPPSWKL